MSRMADDAAIEAEEKRKQTITETNKTETVTMPKEEYLEMREAAQMFYRLQGAGVDNWEGYDIAMEEA